MIFFEKGSYITQMKCKLQWKEFLLYSFKVGFGFKRLTPLDLIAFANMEIVMPQFNWWCDVCGCVISLTWGIYWVKLGFINYYKKPQLWLVLLRYSADVANIILWVVTYGIRAGLVIPCGFRDTNHTKCALTRT